MSLHRLDEILDLSERMLHCAQAGEWDRVQWLEARRQRYIDECFPLDEPIPDPARVKARLEKIIDLDRRVVALAEATRGSVVEEAMALRRGRAATAAYGQAGG